MFDSVRVGGNSTLNERTHVVVNSSRGIFKGCEIFIFSSQFCYVEINKDEFIYLLCMRSDYEWDSECSVASESMHGCETFFPLKLAIMCISHAARFHKYYIACAISLSACSFMIMMIKYWKTSFFIISLPLIFCDCNNWNIYL